MNRESGLSAGRVIALVGCLLGLLLLVLQFSLTVPARLALGDDLPGALGFFFSFFTILSNMALVAAYASEVTGWGWLGWFRSARTRAMLAAAIAMVMIFYHVVLAPIWDPQGLFKLADIGLHSVTPVFFIAWWIGFNRHGTLRLSDLPMMLLPTFVYFLYAMARGALVGAYPYPILEANRLGYVQVGLNALMMVVFLLVLSLIVVGLDRVLSKRMPG